MLGKRTADNTKQGAKDTKSDVSKAAAKVKESFKKATADTIHVPPKPDSAKAKPDSAKAKPDSRT